MGKIKQSRLIIADTDGMLSKEFALSKGFLDAEYNNSSYREVIEIVNNLVENKIDIITRDKIYLLSESNSFWNEEKQQFEIYFYRKGKLINIYEIVGNIRQSQNLYNMYLSGRFN